MNLFLLLAALGLSHSLFGERLLPVGTLYDPFVCRGLDALNYACYQDARFIVAGTPSGITLAPEGGAHQSIGTPLIGMAQDGLATFEPAYVDELAAIMDWAFDYIQREGAEDGERALASRREGRLGLPAALHAAARPAEPADDARAAARTSSTAATGCASPEPGADLAIVYTGAVAPEAIEAAGLLAEDRRGVGVLAVTSADRLSAGWHAAQRAREQGQSGCPRPRRGAAGGAAARCRHRHGDGCLPRGAVVARRRARPPRARAGRGALRPVGLARPSSTATTAST